MTCDSEEKSVVTDASNARGDARDKWIARYVLHAKKLGRNAKRHYLVNGV